MSKERFSLLPPVGLTYLVGLGETEKINDREIISERVPSIAAVERELDNLSEQIE